MDIDNYKTVYVSIDIDPTSELIDKQKEICNSFNLIPRNELHITIAYLGEVDPEKIPLLHKALSIGAYGLCTEIIPSGFGIAIENNGVASLEYDESIIKNNDLPIVSWLSVKNNDAQISFRNNLIEVAINLGFDSTYLRPTYTPHITIGSNGPSDGNDWSLWDVHGVDKTKTINSIVSPSIIVPRKLHITNATIHPDSLMILEEC